MRMRYPAGLTTILLALMWAVPASPAPVTLTGSIVGQESGTPLDMETWVAVRRLDRDHWATLHLASRGKSSYSVALPGEGRYQIDTRFGSFWYGEDAASIGNFESTQTIEVYTEEAEFVHDLHLPDPVAIPVRVVDAVGEPIAGAKVSLSRMTPEYKEDYGALSIMSSSDKRGRCDWLAVAGHEIWVSASADGYTWTTSKHYTLSPGDEISAITLTLRKVGTISATLVDEANRPLANKAYKLVVQNTNGTPLKGRYARTDARGRLRADGFLVRDALRIALKEKKNSTPYFTYEFDGPADKHLNLGRVVVAAD